jgi:Uma2 family endonuclease
VISPSNRDYGRKTKSDTYLAMGIREMWLVDTNAKEVEVRYFEGNSTKMYGPNDVVRSMVFPKIEIAISGLFL